MHSEWDTSALSAVDAARACYAKQHYPTKTAARDRAAIVKKMTGLDISVYRCPVCHEYHITRVPKDRQPDVKARLRDKKAIDNSKSPC